MQESFKPDDIPTPDKKLTNEFNDLGMKDRLGKALMGKFMTEVNNAYMV